MEMNEYSISIILPAYNAENTIEESVKSILSQNYKKIECIIIENNSTDKTYEVCKKLAEATTSIKLFSCKCKGVSEARNIGLKNATGDIIGFCDSDDCLMPETFANVNKEFKNNKELSCVIGAFFNECNGIKTYKELKRKTISAEEAIKRTICDDKIMGSVCNKYYKKEVLNGLFFDEELTHCEDTHFNVAVMSQKNFGKVLISNNIFYNYKYNPNSATTRKELLFNDNNELKYICAMNKIINIPDISNEVVQHVSMAKVILAIDIIEWDYIDKPKYDNLFCELRNNYIYLIKFFYKYNLKRNIKKILKLLKIFIKNKAQF